MDYAEMSPSDQARVKNFVERVSVELALPSAKEMLAWNAEDPLASVHYYTANMRVLLLFAFEIRMCFRCPYCNQDLYDVAAATFITWTSITTPIRFIFFVETMPG